MKTAVRSVLSNVFPNAIHVICIPHALNLILEEWPRQFDSLNSIVAPIKRLYCQSILNFSSQDFMNSGTFKIFERATSLNGSHTIGANHLCIALNANSGSNRTNYGIYELEVLLKNISVKQQQNNSLVCLCVLPLKIYFDDLQWPWTACSVGMIFH